MQEVYRESHPKFRGTTVLCVRGDDSVVMASDGQISLGDTIIKAKANKLRTLSGSVLAGFAGSVADAVTLIDLLEKKLKAHNDIVRATIELCKDWRSEKYLRKLDASMIIANKSVMMRVSGNGDAIECDDRVAAIGSGGDYAYSAAMALISIPDIKTIDIVKRSMHIAADMCIYTNHELSIEVLS